MDITNMMGIWGPGPFASFSLLLIALIVWSLFWKGFALWHSAKRGDTWWFIVLLLLNTAGILEIIYIFLIAKIPEFRSRLGLK